MKETSEGNTPIHPTQRWRQWRYQQFEGLEKYDYQVDPQTGWRTYTSSPRGNPRQPTSSSSSSQWEQYDDWSKSWISWRSSSWTEQRSIFLKFRDVLFACRKFEFPGTHARHCTWQALATIAPVLLTCWHSCTPTLARDALRHSLNVFKRVWTHRLVV